MSKKNIRVTAILLVLAIASLIFGITFASKVATYSTYDEVLDASVMEVVKMAAVSGTAAAVLDAITIDAVGQEFAELTEYFIFILAILYLEKIMMPVFGLGVFEYVLPISLLVMTYAFWTNKQKLKDTVFKVIIGSIALYAVIPISTNLIRFIRTNYDVLYKNTIEQIIETDPVSDVVEIVEANGVEIEEVVIEVSEVETIEETEHHWYDFVKSNSVTDTAEEAWMTVTSSIQRVSDGFLNMLKNVSDTISNFGTMIVSYGKDLLNKFIMAIAVQIITSCLIPIITFFVFTTLMKVFFKFDLFTSVDDAKAKVDHLIGKDRRDAVRREELDLDDDDKLSIGFSARNLLKSKSDKTDKD